MSKDTANVKDSNDINNENAKQPQRPPLQTVTDNDDVSPAMTAPKEENDANVTGKKRGFNEIEANPSSLAPANKKARQSVEGNIYEIVKILDVRDSMRRENDKEFLVQWKSYPLYQATWHHRDNFTDETIVEQYLLLPACEKKKRRTAWRRSWKAFSTHYCESNASHATKSTQTTTKDEESDSEDIEIMHPVCPTCPGADQHWVRVKDSWDELQAATAFTLIKHPKNIACLMAFISNLVLFLRDHTHCQQELSGIKSNLRTLYQYFVDILHTYESDDEDDVDECEFEEPRSEDSQLAGSQTDGELTDKTEAAEADDDFDPSNDI